MGDKSILLDMIYDKHEMDEYLYHGLYDVTESRTYYTLSEQDGYQMTEPGFTIQFKIYWPVQDGAYLYYGVTFEICDLKEVI